MLRLGRGKTYQSLLMAAVLVFAVGCVRQTVDTQDPRAGMTESERRQFRDSFKRDMAGFENDNVYFDFDKSNVRPDMRAVLDAKARFMQEFPSIRAQVEGHCDERGTVEYNIALGHRRSQSAKDYLVSLGVSASRIDTVSYGEERPEDARSNAAAWAKNRRAKFNVIGGIPAGMQ